jgi:hypothetical protein
VHYRNGREAKNGDVVIQLVTAYVGSTELKVRVQIGAFGILFNARPGNDYCNGSIAPLLGGPVVGACLCDCIHTDDLSDILAEKGLDKRPAGK